jgi:hypothetical protein
MVNFGEIKIDKSVSIDGNEYNNGDKNGDIDEPLKKYTHIDRVEINNWKDNQGEHVFFGALKQTVVNLQDRLVGVRKWYGNKRAEDKNSDNKFKDNSLDNSSRRKFLKLMGTVTAIEALKPGELLLGENQELANIKKEMLKRDVQDIKEKIRKEEQENIRIENAIALREVLGEQYLKNGKIDINEETMLNIRYYWIKEYKNGGRQHLGLKSSLERMQPWLNEIKEVFANNLPGIDKHTVDELIYLAIPESHFKVVSKSRAGAKGEYQMMSNTARGEGNIIVDSKVDERLDILANAKGAAKTLFNYYKMAKNDANNPKDAWDLALAKFNGGYIKDYLKKYGRLGSVVKYKTYLGYRQERLNNFFDRVEKERSLMRDIRSKESLESIAKKYRVLQKELKTIINKESGKNAVIIPIRINENGRITKETLDIIFDDYLSDSLENLNYPEKYYAVMEVLKKERLILSEKSDNEEIKFLTIKDLKASWAYWKKGKAKSITLRKINKYIYPPGTEATLQKLREGNPHIQGDNIDLSNIRYDNVRVYFLSNEVLNTQFREFSSIHPRKRKIKYSKK